MTFLRFRIEYAYTDDLTEKKNTVIGGLVRRSATAGSGRPQSRRCRVRPVIVVYNDRVFFYLLLTMLASYCALLLCYG